MSLLLSREDILHPLQKIIGVVESRQVKPLLTHVLLKNTSNKLSITATDLEIEIVCNLESTVSTTFNKDITLPAQKLLDICRTLPESSKLEFNHTDNDKIEVKSGKNIRFLLSSLPTEEFPSSEDLDLDESVSIPQNDLRSLIEKTSFAMANQDARYYLNGLLFEMDAHHIKTVATNGHRLALSQISYKSNIEGKKRIIIPRKGIHELQKLLKYDDEHSGDEEYSITISLDTNHFRASLFEVQLTSNLIDGEFPEYQRVLPDEEGNRNRITIRKVLFKQALTRASILSDSSRGVRLILDNDLLQIQAPHNNSKYEKLEENMEIEYKGERIEVGFNVDYLLDVLNVLESENVVIFIRDAHSSVLLLPHLPKEDISTDPMEESRYVIMPMRL